jgi:hypothetical protein
MTSKLLIAAAVLAVVLPVSAHAQEYKFSNEREVGKSRYATEWKDFKSELKGQQRVAAQPSAAAQPNSPMALNATAPASGTEEYTSEMFPNRGIKRAQAVPTSSYNQ